MSETTHEIKFTGDPVKFDGVEGRRDPKTGKGRFDLIPEEVYYPLFSKATHDWLLDCHPASILMLISDEKFIEAIIKMTVYSYATYNEHYAASSSEFWNGVWPMLQDLAIHFQKGAEHYGERNCQKGIPLWSFKDSAMRHATQVFEGKTDEPHAISVIWNCWMAEWTVIQERKREKTVDAISGPAMKLNEMVKDLCNTPTNKEPTALSERQLFDKQFVDLLSTPEGKERARWFYGPDDLFNDLIDRVENERGVGKDYRDYLSLLIKLNRAYEDYLQKKNNDK